MSAWLPWRPPSRKKPRPDLADRLRARALRLLARRDHSRAELAAKLSGDAEDPEVLRQLLDDLEGRGWLSEARVIESVLHNRRSRFGIARIEQELRSKGVSEQAIEQVRERAASTELQAAQAVWAKKFGELPASLGERARQSRFLASRGFSPAVIRQVLKGQED